METLARTARRYTTAIRSLGGQAALSLSGGLDSRCLASVLRSDLVGTVTYGHPDCEEVAIASQVAQSINLPHHLIPTHRHEQFLNQILVRKAVFDIGATARFNCGIGVRVAGSLELPFRVWIPGHTGDFISGGHINRGSLLVRRESQASQLIADNHRLLNDSVIGILLPGLSASTSWCQTIAEQMCFNPQDVVGSIERWDCEQRQRRMIFTDLRAYEGVGRWLIPFWDNELVDFFCALPVELKYHQRLYIGFLMHRLFIGEYAELGLIPRSEKGRLRPVRFDLKDRVVLAQLPATIADRLFQRGSLKKSLLRDLPCNLPSSPPNEPDPITRWWFDSPVFRREVSNVLSDWDGLNGMIDLSGLRRLLESKDPPCSFIKYGVPSLLTMRFLQELLNESRSSS